MKDMTIGMMNTQMSYLLIGIDTKLTPHAINNITVQSRIVASVSWYVSYRDFAGDTHPYATPVTSLSPPPLFRFFYSNKNYFVQLEDTIKTERGCSMQSTKRTTVPHHRSDFIYYVKRADWQEVWGETDKTMAEEFQN